MSAVALRFVYLTALAVWLGGMIVLGATVAPSLFQTLQALHPDGRAFAGEAFKEVLTRFHSVAYVCGGTALAALALLAILGPRPRRTGLRALLLAAMIGVAVYSGRRVLTEIDGIQREVGTLPSRLAAADRRRVRFDELHLLATRLMVLNIIGVLALLAWEATDQHEPDDIVGTP